MSFQIRGVRDRLQVHREPDKLSRKNWTETGQQTLKKTYAMEKYEDEGETSG